MKALQVVWRYRCRRVPPEPDGDEDAVTNAKSQVPSVLNIGQLIAPIAPRVFLLLDTAFKIVIGFDAKYQQVFANSQNVKFNPVFHTSGIAPAGGCPTAADTSDIEDVVDDLDDPLQPGCPPSFGSEANMIQWIHDFALSPAALVEDASPFHPSIPSVSTLAPLIRGHSFSARETVVAVKFWINSSSTTRTRQFAEPLNMHRDRLLTASTFGYYNFRTLQRVPGRSNCSYAVPSPWPEK